MALPRRGGRRPQPSTSQNSYDLPTPDLDVDNISNDAYTRRQRPPTQRSTVQINRSNARPQRTGGSNAAPARRTPTGGQTVQKNPAYANPNYSRPAPVTQQPIRPVAPQAVDDDDDDFFEEDAPAERPMSYRDYYPVDDDYSDYDSTTSTPMRQAAPIASIDNRPPQTSYTPVTIPQYQTDSMDTVDDGIVYTDNINDILDKKGLIKDGPGAPRLREYPKMLPDGLGPRVRRLQPNGKYKIIQGLSYEQLLRISGQSDEAKERFKRDVNDHPYDSTGHLRIFLASPVGRPYELGSMSEAQKLADSLRAKQSQIFDSSINLHYREGDSLEYKEPQWPTKSKKK